MYDLPTVQDSAAYRKHQRSCEEPHPCKCELNPEKHEEESLLSRKVAMACFGELVSHLRESNGRLT